MTLLVSGKRFIRDLEKEGALGLYMPPEGGFEGRYLRRLRAFGYVVLPISAPGLGDLASYFTQIHGVRPAHLGKSTSGSTDWGIQVQFLPPILNYRLENLPPKTKGLALWLIDGKSLDLQELAYLSVLPSQETQVKILIELGGDRQFSWKSLKDCIHAQR
jgi:NAD(P)H-quinone oxidoreductase subunit N